MPESEIGTVTTTRHVVLDAKRGYRIAAGIIAPAAILGAVLIASFDDKSFEWRLLFAGLCLLGGIAFAIAAFFPRPKIPLGTKTVTTPRD